MSKLQPPKNIPSIDLRMYAISETKDVIMKKIERLVKEVSFDCALTKERNYITGYDGQRECDYDKCDYQCTGIIETPHDPSTYNLYYSDTSNVEKFLRIYFLTHFHISLKKTIATFPELELFEIISAITSIIDRNISFINAYGFVTFLRIQGDILYTTSDPKTTSQKLIDIVPLGDYYAKNLIIENGDSFADLVDNMYNDTLPDKIQKIFDNPLLSRTFVMALPPDVQSILLQGCILAKEIYRSQKNSKVRDDILELFNGYYGKFDNVWKVWLNSDVINSVCYNIKTEKWEECIVPKEIQNKRRMEYKSSPIGYSGLWNPDLKYFCIRDLKNLENAKDLRTIMIGRRCIDWEHDKLVTVIVKDMKIDPPLSFEKNKSIDELLELLTKYKSTKKSMKQYTINDDERKDINTVRRVLYWSKSTRSDICEAMKKWFEENDLMESSFDCGHQRKRRNK